VLSHNEHSTVAEQRVLPMACMVLDTATQKSTCNNSSPVRRLWCITDTAKQRRRHAPKLNMSTDDVQTVPCRGAKQAVATHLDKGKPQDVVRHTVEPQRFQVLPVSAVAGDQELGSDEGCQGNCCPPGNHNGEHSCPNSHLQPTRPRLAQGHQP